MEVFEGHQALFRPLARPSVALGNFDGFHIGHQSLLARAKASAGAGDDVVVYTFEPHPLRVLAPAKAPPLLTTRERKLELFAAAGATVCILEPFTKDIAALPPESFFEDILVRILGVRHVVVGYDFTFGKKATGNTDLLLQLGQRAGVQIDILPAVCSDDVVVSSTRVRALLETGDVASVEALLGRPYDVDGTVVHGAKRGRTLGFPTANIAHRAELLPADGVYAVRFLPLDGGIPPLAGAASIGTNPTFGDNPRTLEVFCLDFDGDLYDLPVRVQFVQKLRGQETFSSVEDLVAQMNLDVDQARIALSRKDSSDV